MSLRRRDLQALVCGDTLPRLRYSSMSCRTGQGGSLQYAVSRTPSPRAPIESHKPTCDMQKPACELSPALRCPGTPRPRFAQRNYICSARRGGCRGSSPKEQAAYQRVAKPYHCGYVAEMISRASGEAKDCILTRAHVLAP